MSRFRDINMPLFREATRLELLDAPVAVPANGVIFELTLDGDAVDPMEVLRADGFNPDRGWQFKGLRVSGVQTRSFMLISIGFCHYLSQVKEKAGHPLAKGQWREAFRKKYPNPSEGDWIGFGGSEWLDPYGRRRIPFLFHPNAGGHRMWGSGFDLVATDFERFWRWLVEVE